MLEYSNESSDYEEADMRVAEWNYSLNLNYSYALAYSRLLKISKTKYTTRLILLNMIGFLITYYRKNKLNYQIIKQLKHIYVVLIPSRKTSVQPTDFTFSFQHQLRSHHYKLTTDFCYIKRIFSI
jgi:hypothetical protein